MMRAAIGSLVCLLLGAGSLAFAETAAARVAFEERLTDTPSLAASWPKAAATDLPVMARLIVDARIFDPDADGRYHAEALTQRLQAYRDKGVTVWLAIDGIPHGPPATGATRPAEAQADAPLFRRVLDGRFAAAPITIVELLLPETMTRSACAPARTRARWRRSTRPISHHTSMPWSPRRRRRTRPSHLATLPPPRRPASRCAICSIASIPPRSCSSAAWR
jgi:hypothetical protein